MVETRQEAPLERTVRVLAAGGCAVYPTETFYALGAAITSAQALERVNAIKGRPRSKPLPVILGDMSQLECVLDQKGTPGAWPGYATAMALMEAFWPGPLSIIVPARAELPGQVKDASGGVSLRLTPHPQARELCLRVGSPLAATSANVSGDPAVSTVSGLSAAVCLGADYVLAGEPGPAGGQASTVVKPVPGHGIILFRQGAVSLEALASAGFILQEDM